MSWIRTITQDLVNLDQIVSIGVYVKENVEEGDAATHCVVAKDAFNEEHWLAEGTDTACTVFLASIARKLPMVQP